MNKRLEVVSRFMDMYGRAKTDEQRNLIAKMVLEFMKNVEGNVNE